MAVGQQRMSRTSHCKSCRTSHGQSKFILSCMILIPSNSSEFWKRPLIASKFHVLHVFFRRCYLFVNFEIFWSICSPKKHQPAFEKRSFLRIIRPSTKVWKWIHPSTRYWSWVLPRDSWSSVNRWPLHSCNSKHCTSRNDVRNAACVCVFWMVFFCLIRSEGFLKGMLRNVGYAGILISIGFCFFEK